MNRVLPILPIWQRTVAIVVTLLILCLGQAAGQWRCTDGSLCPVCQIGASLGAKSADDCGAAPAFARENCTDCCHFEAADFCRAAAPKTASSTMAPLFAVLPSPTGRLDVHFSPPAFAPLFAQPPPADKAALRRRLAPRGPPFFS